MTEQESNKNLLHLETSPYLLQHADNPVAWYPWGEAALQRAANENKPILLSIGYSACHWCHVMAHESFEDTATAEIMNQHFINIKVDREERPDIDKIYQTAQQLLTGRTGGWPLTMFLMPDSQIPFFGGTYFPPQPRYGMPGFPDLLERIAQAYQEQGQEIAAQNEEFMQTLDRFAAVSSSEASTIPDESSVHACITQLQQSFDNVDGGFGGAPKFPHPSNLEFLFQAGSNTDSQQSHPDPMYMVSFTLEKMAKGGIYDQLGGGFCRYSVDNRWHIPHFEKMLYDNGPLLGLYSQAWHQTSNELFQQTARATADWVIRDMQSEHGGYFSSLDADSEGEEGRFYVWQQEEVAALLTTDEHSVLVEAFGMNLPANFEGKWHFFQASDIENIAQSSTVDKEKLQSDLSSAREKLLAVRNDRIWPGRDEKILTSWNGLMIKGMATAARIFQEDKYFHSAEKALNFVHTTMWQDDRLMATHKDGKTHLNAYLDDHVFLIDAILEHIRYRWNTNWFNFALQLADVLLQHFYEADGGGFYFTAHDHEKLIQRRMDFMDDALPSGNAIAVSVLARLGYLTGREDLHKAAEQTLQAGSTLVQRAPHACTALLQALDEFATPPATIILRGDEQEIMNWQNQLHDLRSSRIFCYAIPSAEASLPGILAEKTPPEEKTTAWLCEGYVCREPCHEIEEIFQHLKTPS